MSQPRWEPISKSCRIMVSDSHGFGTDAMLLADFSLPKPGEICLDVGSGCGIIPMIWQERSKAKSITGLELQEEAAELFRGSVTEAGCGDRVRVLLGDAREYRSMFASGSIDRISCNPPYFETDRGLQSAHGARRLARQDRSFTLDDLAKLSAYCLKFSGSCSFCGRPQRLWEAADIFSKHKLEPKRLRLVQQRRDKAPFMFLMECRSGGKPGLEIMSTLILQENGEDTPELLSIYGDYRENAKWKNLKEEPSM